MAKYLKLNENSSERFSFFDGPITANNQMGVHHAWGRTLKDTVLRYQTLLGKKLRYQNGFDCQGLWIEVEVEKSLKLNSKKEILDYGLENFSKACSQRVDKYGTLITEQSKQLGQFMDWDHSYWTHSDNNIEHIWYFLGKCHENGWLYKGHRIMPWCTRCETSLSQHEQTDSYKEMVHPSIYVQFEVSKASAKLQKLVGNKKFYFLVWTTTPWTLPANVAVAVNPTLWYVVIRNESSLDTFVVGETSFNKLKDFIGFVQVCKFLGKDLVGSELQSLTESFVPKQKDLKVRVLKADFVSEEDGTGLVHIAPGCGLDDFELGKKENLPFLAPLDDNGTFLEEFGFKGLSHFEVSSLVQKKLVELGSMFKKSSLKHRYPVCWRCGHELVFRLVDEWFIKTDEIRPKLLNAVEEVTWHPYYMKDHMKNWLSNMGDWCISRKRFWGLPLPFFECTCGNLTVVSRLQELYNLAGYSSEKEFRKQIPDLHRPFVDDLEINCPNCHQKVKRVLAVGDCWLDAGIVPFSTLNYLENHKKNSYWDSWFPADFVVEMREQIRLWFYSQLFMSVTLTGKAPYKNVMAHEKVFDEKGKPMHKSKGNALWWSDTADKVGSDSNRLFYTSWDPTKSLLFGFNNIKKSLNNFNTFWSCCRFFQQNISLSPNYWSKLSVPVRDLSVDSHLDKWLLFNLKKTHEKVHELYREYKIHEMRQLVDNFWQKISTFWLRNRRNQFWAYEKDSTNDENLCVYQLLWQTILLTVFWLAPVAPHVTEYLFQTVVRPFTDEFKESLHLNHFYEPDFSNVESLSFVEDEVIQVESVLEVARNLRQSAKVKIRYTLPELFIDNSDKEKLQMLETNWLDVLVNELNVKQIRIGIPDSSTEEFSSLSKSGFDVYLPLHFDESLKTDWLQSEVFRTVQFLRKEAKLSTNQKTLTYFDFQTQDFNDFLTKKFVERLKSDALVDLVNEKIFTTQKESDPKNWLFKEVKFNSKSLKVYLLPLLNQ